MWEVYSVFVGKPGVSVGGVFGFRCEARGEQGSSDVVGDVEPGSGERAGDRGGCWAGGKWDGGVGARSVLGFGCRVSFFRCYFSSFLFLC